MLVGDPCRRKFKGARKQVPVPPISINAVFSVYTSVMTRSPTYQLLTVLATLFVGLGWGASVAHTACGAVGSTGPDRCGSADSAEHCESDRAPTSAVCFTHHASQEALTSTSPAPDVQGGGSVGTEAKTEVPATGTVISSLTFDRPAAKHAGRLHLHVSVWLE